MTKTQRIRVVNAGLLIAFSICYLEWGKDNAAFIFQVEYTIFSKESGLMQTLTHPVILPGLVGQILLIISILKKTLNKTINLTGVLLLGFIVLFLLYIGICSANYKIMLSTVPYITLSALYFYIKKKDKS